VGNNRLVSVEDDGTVLVWHTEFGTQLCSLREGGTTACVRFAVSPDQRWLACRLSNGDISLIDLSRGETASTSADPADGQP
jgi:WD40 repeat protein